jgi:hypothetical protein
MITDELTNEAILTRMDRGRRIVGVGAEAIRWFRPLAIPCGSNWLAMRGELLASSELESYVSSESLASELESGRGSDK